MDGTNTSPISQPDAHLPRYLKALVTALSVTMILGVILIVGVIVMRFNADTAVPLPAAITLPDGATATAFTRGPDWLAVVTADGHILIYDPDGKTLRQDIEVK